MGTKQGADRLDRWRPNPTLRQVAHATETGRTSGTVNRAA